MVSAAYARGGLSVCRPRRRSARDRSGNPAGSAERDRGVGANSPTRREPGRAHTVQRETVMKKFRERRVQLLVATDVAARGLDVDDLSHVIHYDLPDEPEVYTHRSGRTGRAGKSGVSLAIINMREKHKLREIERNLKGTIAQVDVPTGEKSANVSSCI